MKMTCKTRRAGARLLYSCPLLLGNLVLLCTAQQQSAPAAAQPAAAQPAAKPEFESSGIRGLIDPGGYSASSAGAASGFLRGIADVKRTEKDSAASIANQWPCGLEPKLRLVVETNPASKEANLRLGQFYTAHEEPLKAIPLLKQVLALEPGDKAGSHQLATAWLESGDFEDARALLSTIAQGADAQAPDPEAHQLLARAEEGLGQFHEAARQYRIAAAEESSAESLFGVGYESVLAGALPDGHAAFAQGVAQYPRSIALRLGLGATQFLEHKTVEAVHSFLDAAEIDPSNPRPYSFLAQTLGLTNDEAARVSSAFRRFLALRPASAQANYFYALSLSFDPSLSDSSRIEGLLGQAIRLDPNLAKPHLLLADTLAQRQDYANAVPEYEAAIRLDSSLNAAHYRLALAYQRLGKTDQSAREMQLFRIAMQSAPASAAETDLAQFISVMSEPDQHSSQEWQCPANSR